MKRMLFSAKALCVLLCLLTPALAFATTANDCGNDVPLDGGLSLLIAAGAGYGAKKIAEKRKKNKVS